MYTRLRPTARRFSATDGASSFRQQQALQENIGIIGRRASWP